VTPSGPYRIDASGRVMDQIRVLGVRAVRNGLVADFATALATLWTRLVATPTTWGDPVSNLRNLNLVMYRRVQGPIIVYYAVDDVNRISYVHSVWPFPGRGLEAVP